MNKHRISTTEESSVRHQRHQPIAHFGIIGGNAFLWIEETEGSNTRRVTYRTFTTGEHIPDGWGYIKTAQDPTTGISAHLYQKEAGY